MGIVVGGTSEDQVKVELKAIREVSRNLLKSREVARKYLIGEGSITESGKLTKACR